MGLNRKKPLRADPETEEWRTAPGYPAYEVSNRGRVRRARRPLKGGPGRVGKVLSATPTSHGYISVSLLRDRKKATVMVHRLVAKAFLEEPEDFDGKRLEVNHIDGDKTNADVDNLEWVGSAENHAHACRNGLTPTGEDHYRARHSDDVIRRVRDRYAAGGVSQRALAAEYGVTQSTIWRWINGVGRAAEVT